ncbi:hypothetical protein [Qipengyuania sp. RANM35]|uniref:hypothetical protein n=1 Tax=Qipengyuania sp. RANM35 TaxID=3068635 RepID=UPI0034DB30BF
MGRSFIFYTVVAIGLVIIALNADDIEGRQGQASLTETLLVVGGVMLVLFGMRAALAKFNASRDRRE